MNRTISSLLEGRGIDGNLYAFGRVIEGVEPEPAERTIYELEQPIPIDQPHVITFDLDPASVRALHVDATFTYGGPLKPGTRCPLLWLTWDNGSEWKETTAPLYVFVRAENGGYVMRSRLRGKWISQVTGTLDQKISGGETHCVYSTVRPVSVDTRLYQLDGSGEIKESLLMSAAGIPSPFGDAGVVRMRLQIGHRDAREDVVGDEELPAGSVLKSLRVWSE